MPYFQEWVQGRHLWRQVWGVSLQDQLPGEYFPYRGCGCRLSISTEVTGQWFRWSPEHPVSFPSRQGVIDGRSPNRLQWLGPVVIVGILFFSEWKTVTLEVKSCWNEKRTFMIALQAAIWLFLLLFVEAGRKLNAFAISQCSPVELGCNKNKNLPVTPEHFSRLLFLL